MLVRRLSIIFALVQLAALSLAIPIIPNTDMEETASLVPRSEFCSNAHLTKAGTRHALASSSSDVSLGRRDDNGIIWCARGSRTYVVIHVGWQVASSNMIGLLGQAYDLTVSHVHAQGDGLLHPLPTGIIGTIFNLHDYAHGLTLTFANANNHQTTWGVLGAACSALKDFVAQRGSFTELTFAVYDGVNQVASGSLK